MFVGKHGQPIAAVDFGALFSRLRMPENLVDRLALQVQIGDQIESWRVQGDGADLRSHRKHREVRLPRNVGDKLRVVQENRVVQRPVDVVSSQFSFRARVQAVVAAAYRPPCQLADVCAKHVR